MGVGGKGTGGMISWASILLRCATIRWKEGADQGVSARLAVDRARRLRAGCYSFHLRRPSSWEGGKDGEWSPE